MYRARPTQIFRYNLPPVFENMSIPSCLLALISLLAFTARSVVCSTTATYPSLAFVLLVAL